MGRRLKSVIQKILIRAAIFLVYLFIGAGVFLAIERTSEYEKTVADYEAESILFRNKHNISENEMRVFLRKTEEAVRGGYFKYSKSSEWNFVNAFFFSGNIVTTIGYGHIVPRAAAGRIVCMLYALVGIPLTAFFLRTVGNELTSFISNSVKSYERRAYNREAERLEMKSAIVSCGLALIMLFLGGLVFSLSEEWTYLDAFYFCFISLTTIGFGDFIPGQRRVNLNAGESLAVELAALIYYVMGLSIMSGVILSISKLIEEKTKKLDLYDPLDAIANMNIENLNEKALTKLGYKMPQGTANMLARRGTIIPGGTIASTLPKRLSYVPDDVDLPMTKSQRRVFRGQSLLVNSGDTVLANEHIVKQKRSRFHANINKQSSTSSGGSEDESGDRLDIENETTSATSSTTREESIVSVFSHEMEDKNQKISRARSKRRPRSSPLIRTVIDVGKSIHAQRRCSTSNLDEFKLHCSRRESDCFRIEKQRLASFCSNSRVHPKVEVDGPKQNGTKHKRYENR